MANRLAILLILLPTAATLIRATTLIQAAPHQGHILRFQPEAPKGNANTSGRPTAHTQLQDSTALAKNMMEEADSLQEAIPDDDFRIKMMQLARRVFWKLKEEEKFNKLSRFHFDWWAFPSTVSSLSNNYLNFKMTKSEVERFAKVPGASSAYLGSVEAFLDVQLKADANQLSDARTSKVLQSLLEWHKFSPPSGQTKNLIKWQALRFLTYVDRLEDARFPFPHFLQKVLRECRDYFVLFQGGESTM